MIPNMLTKFFLLFVLFNFASAVSKLDEVFAWKELSFAWPSGIKDPDYIPANNLPLGLARWKNKLFVTVPRWKAGVATSLAYVSLDEPVNKEATLIPYPDWKSNTLPKGGEKPAEDQIISTFRVSVDPCDRLWVMDTGLADILGNPTQISPPAIVIFDLNTDKLIRRYPLKPSDLKEDSFLANIVVDVTKDTCDRAFAYIPDLGGYGLVVYSLADNDSWRITHNYFHFDPLQGNMTVGGINFQWTDGVFGIALGPINENGYRTAYFHPLASLNEFSVSTEVLKNKTASSQNSYDWYNLFKLEGHKGENSQTSASVFDEQSKVLLFTQLTKDGVACWNSQKKLSPENVALIAQDAENLIFTNDIKLDQDRNLWILSDKMPVFLYKQLNPNEVNYRIFKVKVEDAIAETPCAA